MTWWQVDDQSLNCAPAHLHQLGGDDLEMPVHRQLGLRIELLEAAGDEGGEVLAQQRLVLGARQVVTHRKLVPPRLLTHLPPPLDRTTALPFLPRLRHRSRPFRSRTLAAGLS